MNTLKTTLCGIVLLLCFGFKPEDPLEKLLKQIAKLNNSYPQEKIHVHTDKPFYGTGENIWLKAYLVTAEKNEPSALSSNLYVELIDSKNKIRKKITLQIASGFANGNITIPDSLISGSYRLRAYTNYMRNYDQHFFFEKSVLIGNLLDKKASASNKANEEFTLQFFPEGGNFIANTRTKIGIKAVQKDGNGVNLTGYIVNTKDEKVAVFNTEYASMGAFAINALQNEKYRAIVTLTNGKTKSFDLPETSISGYALGVNLTEANLNVRVTKSQNITETKELFIVIQSNGIVYSSIAIKAENAVTLIPIPLESLPTGINQVTVFDNNLNPIAERLAFINHEDNLTIDVKTLASNNYIKKKTSLEIDVKDSKENPIDGNFSIAITDMSKVNINEDDETSIMSNLLLTSDLKGFIEKPNYYFNNITEDKKRHLDNLLLTQGWRRFTWKDVTTDNTPTLKYRVEKSLELSGTVSYENSKKPVPNAKVILLSTNKNYFMLLDTVADLKGNFLFDKLDLPDTVNFILQAKTAKDNENVIIKINQSPLVQDVISTNESIDIQHYLEETKKYNKELQKHKITDDGILLKTVNIQTKKSAIPVPVKNSTNLAGQSDYLVTKDFLKYHTDLFQAFYSIPGVMINKGKIVRRRASTVSITSPDPGGMLIYMDGSIINQDILKATPPSDVETIEILVSNYNLAIYGSAGYNGVIIITTKKFDQATVSTAVNKLRISNTGYATIKEFYVPNYDDPKVDKQMEDLRSTIYWNSSIITDIKGKASLSYFNAGTPGTYRVIIEGIDNFGNIGRKTIMYKVEKDQVQ